MLIRCNITNSCKVLLSVILTIGLIWNLVSAEQTASDPAAALIQPETTVSPAEQRYTDEEYAALTDEEKRNVYFQLPWKLPKNFLLETYSDILYPKPKKTEN